MLIRLNLVFILFFFASCAARNSSYGYVVDGVSDKDKNDVQVVRFSHSRGVIFPAGYGRQFFSRDTSMIHATYFTPDTALIWKMERSISDQYCAAMVRFNRSTGLFSEQELKRFEVKCSKWQKNLKYKDKQYIGYISAKGEKIILVNIVDFSKDPYHLKRTLTFSWIIGFDGWFATNVGGILYNVDKNLFF
jgi:hypothetical protein